MTREAVGITGSGRLSTRHCLRGQRRRRSIRCGFTLIELLIVVAILGLMSASLLAVVTAPAEERILADVDNAFESGGATLFGALVSDAHGAQRLEQRVNPVALVFFSADTGSRDGSRTGSAIVYFVDAKRNLRRAVATPGDVQEFLAGGDESEKNWRQRGAALLSDVESLRAEPVNGNGAQEVATGTVWRLSVRAVHRQIGHEQVFDRHVDAAVGLPALKGGRR